MIDSPSNSISPCFGVKQAGDRAERRRLSGPVAADERHDFAFVDVERDAAQRLDRAVGDAQIFDRQEWHCDTSLLRFRLAGRGRRPDTPRSPSDRSGSPAGVPLAIVTPWSSTDDPLADIHHEPHVVIDQQDRNRKLLANVADRLGQVLLFARVHAGRRLVEQQHLRLRGQRAHDFQTPLMAVAEATRPASFARVRRSNSSSKSSASFADRRLLRTMTGRPQHVPTSRCRPRHWPARRTLSSTLSSGNSRMF